MPRMLVMVVLFVMVPVMVAMLAVVRMLCR